MDSKKKYEQMVEDGEITPKKYINHVARCNPLYIYLLDFSSGEVIRYNISALAKEENGWNPDSESCEAYLYGKGHRLGDCEWMVTTQAMVTEI